MMDNKLSELSKPVGTAFKSDVELMRSGRMIHGQMTVWRGCAENQVTEGVYSQEYVSALLAELEAKDKRIAELEAKLNHYVAVERASASFDQAADIIKRADDAEREAGELRTRLATPVRLPPADSQGRYHGMMTRFAIKKAGFTVQGDE